MKHKKNLPGAIAIVMIWLMALSLVCLAFFKTQLLK
jgi:hypothetical protein